MGESISVAQSRQLIAMFSTSVDFDRIPKHVGQGLIGDPIQTGKQLTRFLATGAQSSIGKLFMPWKRLILGSGYRTAGSFGEHVKALKMRATDIALETYGCCRFVVVKVTLDLFVFSVADFGLDDGATYPDVCARALSVGLKLCPSEVGPKLRLEYRDQPHGEWLFIAMEPVNNHFSSNGFCVENERGMCLSTYPSFRTSDRLKAEDLFVFAREVNE